MAWLLLAAPGCGFHWVTGEGRVGEVSVCDPHGCDTEFLSATEAVSLRIAMEEAPFGTRVASRWLYIEPTGERVLMRERVIDVDHPQWVLFRMEPPRTGAWKAGRYLIEVEVRDRIVARKTFRVAEIPREVPGAEPRAEPRAKSAAEPAPKPTPEPAGTAEMKKDILDDDF